MSVDIDIFKRAGAVPDRDEAARKAVKAFRAMLPTLNAYVRLLTKKPSARIELALRDNGSTDGSKIFYRPPIALGDLRPHQRNLCDKRDPVTRIMRCPTCATREEVLITIYHEIAHIAFGTFKHTSDKDRAKIIEDAIKASGSKYAKALKGRIDSAPHYVLQSYMGLAHLVSEWMPMLINCMEDARVNREMHKARPGTLVMFEADEHRIFEEGFEAVGPDGKAIIVNWRERPLNQQMLIGLYCAASGYNYDEWFHESVVTALKDSKLQTLVRSLDTIRSMAGVYRLGFPLLERLRELGFCQLPDDPDLPEEPEDEQSEEGDSDSSDADTDESTDAESSDPGDGEPGSDQGDSDDGGPGGHETGKGESNDSDKDSSDSRDDDGVPGAGDDSDDREGSGDSENVEAPGRDDVPGADSEASSDDAGHEGTDVNGDEPDTNDSEEQSEDQPTPEEGSGSDAGPEGAGSDAEPVSEPNTDTGEGDPDGDSGSTGDTGPAGSDSPSEGNSDSSTEASESGSAGEGGSDESPGSGDPSDDGTGEGSGGHQGGDGSASDTRSDDWSDVGPGAAESHDPNTGSGDIDGRPVEESEHDGEGSSGTSGVSSDGAPAGEGDSHLDHDVMAGTPSAPEVDRGEGTQSETSETTGGHDDEPSRGDSPLPEGDEESGDDSEVIDTGEDEGGISLLENEKNDNIPLGTPEECREGVAIFGHHHDEEKPKAILEAEQADDKAVQVAIIQGLYFETPSRKIWGVREHRYGEPIYADGVNMSEAFEHDRWLAAMSRNKKAVGIKCDMEIGEDVLGPALQRMRVTFADNARGRNTVNLKSGKVNTGVLGKRAHVGDERLFRKRSMPGKKKYLVIIGIDASGSTVGKNIVLAKRAAKAQAELCDRMGIPFAVYAHSGNFHNPHRGRGDGIDLDIYHIKDVDQPWNAKTRDILDNLGPDSANLDGHSIEFYRKILDKGNATDKILLYYSDGKMPAENYEEELEILQREIRTFKRKNYTLLAVGIRTDSPLEHGLDTVRVDEDADIVKVVRHLEKRLVVR